MQRRILIIIAAIIFSTGVLFAFQEIRNSITSHPIVGKLRIIDPEYQTGIFRFPIGNFQLKLINTGQEYVGGASGPRLVIVHNDAPGRWLWYTRKGEAFVAAALGNEKVDEQRGSFFITDHISRRCANQTIESINTNGDTVSISGSLTCNQDESVQYDLIFSQVSTNQLQFHIQFADPTINRTYLTYASDADEHFFGFGEQFTYFDLKGHLVPIWVSEQGIGRGQQPLTTLVNLAARAGGNPFTTYAAVPFYISSRLRSLFLLNTEYSEFDLRRPDMVQIHVFSSSLTGRILYGDNPEKLIFEYTSWSGRMRPLPDWILNGAILGIQGGTDTVREIYNKFKENGTPISALWLQDWVGQRTTSFGKQLWWNWQLDEARYPGWETLQRDLRKDGVRVMVYTSPFLVDVSEKPGIKTNYFIEAQQKNYFVHQPNGEAYLIKNTDFSAGLIDLTNEKAREWYKNILREELIVSAGASGWMADFGEALPYDAVLSNGETGKTFHNRYPEEWGRLNRELIDSLPNGDEIVFFQRAAFQHSPMYSTLFWEGDQLVSWDQYDGIKSAVTGLLSGGISGFSLNHSDIGGYTTLNNPLAKYKRTKELIFRWMELSALTVVFRSHEGNLPDMNQQIYSDDETVAHFTRMAKIYAAWKPLRVNLVNEAAQYGIPVARHLFIHYPDDANVYNLSYQEFMLGSDVLIAPVLEPERDSVRVYLPAGSWVHLWTGKIYRSLYKGIWVSVPAPIGQPGIFYKEGSQDGINFRLNLMKAGIIE